MKKDCFLCLLVAVIFMQSCSPSNNISRTANKEILQQQDLRSAHIGISIFDANTNSFLYNYQGEKYFVPASNTKLFSLYAGMKYLGDSLAGISYLETDTALFIKPTGDPTLLHPDYQSQPVIDFLKKSHKKIYLIDKGWEETPLGEGWAWDDYNDDYSAERSQLPVYGNFIRWTQQKSA